MKTLLIYNPVAGNGKAGRFLSEVKSELVKKKIFADIVKTDFSGHATDIMKTRNLSEYDGVIAAGGDGTIFEVINGYYSNNGKKKPPIGIIPIGTGNAFVRDFGLKTGDWKTAIEIISNNNTRSVDVGKFRVDGNDYYFLNIIGIGFVADVNKIAQKLKILGNLSYSVGVIYKIILLKSYDVVLELDGKRIERENIFIEVSNTRYTSNFLMAPTAEIDDGLLDVTLLNKTSRRRMLRCFPKIFTGEHVEMDEVETFKAKKISIKTEIPKELTPDGEMFGSSPIDIECLRRDVKVFRK